MKALGTLIVALSGALAMPAVAADATSPMPLEVQPLTHARDGHVRGCGLRLTGGEAAKPVSSWFDVSFNVFASGVGIAQSVAYELRRSDYDGESRPARVPVRSTWIKAAEGSTRRGESSERGETLVYTLLAEDVLGLFEAVAEGRTISIGIRRWGEPADSVHTGVPVLDEAARKSVSACLAQLTFD
jgi:hypothetical protein